MVGCLVSGVSRRRPHRERTRLQPEELPRAPVVAPERVGGVRPEVPVRSRQWNRHAEDFISIAEVDTTGFQPVSFWLDLIPYLTYNAPVKLSAKVKLLPDPGRGEGIARAGRPQGLVTRQ